MSMTTPQGTFTIAEAAEAWIAMIEAPETKATPEQKAGLISQIRNAAPNAKLGNDKAFGAVTNAIKAAMRGGK
jgi:hypothetical protein